MKKGKNSKIKEEGWIVLRKDFLESTNDSWTTKESYQQQNAKWIRKQHSYYFTMYCQAFFFIPTIIPCYEVRRQ